MYQMLEFSAIAFAVWDDVAVGVMCLAPQPVYILGAYIADIHGDGRDTLDNGLQDGWSLFWWDIKGVGEVFIVFGAVISECLK
jgi:hypothetical protein